MIDGVEYDKPVRVAVRQRPVENINDYDIVVKYESNLKNIILVDGRPYCFDSVLGPGVSQKQLFAELIDPLLEKVKRGFNCTALAYGQTGTGKSYTMGLSTEVQDPDEAGVVRQCLWKLLKYIDDFELRASFIEIYNERAFDLLAPCADEPIMAKGFKLSGGTRAPIKTIEDCENILKLGINKRHVRPTVMNSQSSRSHVIFTIALSSKRKTNPTWACLNLVDLAGSEGVRRTGHIGVAKSEGVHINQGLLCIGKIVQAMSEGKKVIPYRDSVLGCVLQDSLNMNSYLTILACISAKRIDLSETLSTIRFAQTTKQLKRTPQMNSTLKELNKTKTRTPGIKKMNGIRTSKDQTGLDLSSSKENSIDAGKRNKTFCTPGKVKRIAAQLNRTEIGLTPKEKTKAERHIITSTTVKNRMPPASKQPIILNSTAQRESLFDHTVEPWNISASTIDTLPSARIPINYSPIINKCMEKFETVLQSKMLSNSYKPISYSPIVQKCMETFENVFETKMLKLMESMMKTNTTNANNAQPDNWLSEDHSTVIDNLLDEDNTPISNVQSTKSQLFTTSSPVFKVPKAPNQRQRMFNEFQSANDEPCIDPKDSSIFEDFINQHTVRHVRRSMRIHERTLENQSIFDNSSIVQQDSLMNNSKRRKRSSIEILKERRRSKRVAAKLEAPPKISKSHPKTKSIVNNSVIASYFNNTGPTKSSTSHSLSKHKKAVLALLNNGSMKELQVLPQIGQKTAFQLVTHRTLNGKYKSIAQVEKLPIWRGNSWERFAQANILL